MTGKGKWVLIVFLAAVVIIALIQNHGPVEFRFLFWEAILSKVILIPLVLLVGFAIGYFAGRQGKK